MRNYMSNEELYRESYTHGKQIFEEKNLCEPGFMSEHFLYLTPKKNYLYKCIDHLPKRMDSRLYLYEFDFNRYSTDEKQRNNYFDYLKRFRRSLMTILGYGDTIFLERTQFEEKDFTLLKLAATTTDYKILDEAIIYSLNDHDATIISVPSLSLLLFVGEMCIIYITADETTEKLIHEVSLANGLYTHDYQMMD